jgi:hypothetical protein
MVKDEWKYDQNRWRAGMTSYEEKVESFKNRILLLPDGVSVDATADRLERMNWVPELLVTVRDFHRITKDVLLSKVVDVLFLDDNETIEYIGNVSMPAERVRLTQASLERKPPPVVAVKQRLCLRLHGRAVAKQRPGLYPFR